MNMYGAIIFASLAVSSILAQTDEKFKGRCPTMTTVYGFDENKFEGRWYEIQRFNNTLLSGHCGIPLHVLKTPEGGFNVAYLARSLKDHKNSTSQFELRRILPGKYDVIVDNKADKIGQQVFATDYEKYAIVWGCLEDQTNPAAVRNIQRVSIYSRTTTLDDATLKSAIQQLKDKNINTDKLVVIEQDDQKCGRRCPTPPIISKFSETKFQGKWYEIKSFHNTGQCGLQIYKEKYIGGFNVEHTTTVLENNKNATIKLELIRKELIIPGNYDVYVNGKQDIIGQQILATDYDTYAIVWGCIENENYLQKLSIYSRSNSMSEETLKTVMKHLKDNGINHDNLVNVEQDNKKCGRSSASTTILPTIFASIMALLLTNKI